MSKLFIIAGHGAGDSGACGNGFQEAERVRVLAQKIKDFGGDEVTLGDFNRNYYKDNGINNLTISKEHKILELHMDSSSNSTAKGAHVVICGRFEADEYDKKLADFISGIFEGRASKIVGRTDLANPNRAANKGYNYRLLECGFISNAEDVKKFNDRMDEIAQGILKCFNIGVKAATETLKPVTTQAVKPATKPAVKPVTKPAATTQTVTKKINTKVQEWQKAAIADGFKFPKYGADGAWGSECESVAQSAIVKKRTSNGKSVYNYSNLTKIVQKAVNVSVDGKCGNDTKNAIIEYQKKHGLTADGCVGLNTWKKILGI